MLLFTWHSSQQLEACNMLFLPSRHGPFFDSLLTQLHGNAYSPCSVISAQLDYSIGFGQFGHYQTQYNLVFPLTIYINQVISIYSIVGQLRLSISVAVWFLHIATIVISTYRLFLIKLMLHLFSCANIISFCKLFKK